LTYDSGTPSPESFFIPIHIPEIFYKPEKFLLELGTGFAYMGREVRIEVGDTEKIIELCLYNWLFRKKVLVPLF
jgi:predicted nuclease of restriction endonuclease-like (RecB) superfamily